MAGRRVDECSDARKRTAACVHTLGWRACACINVGYSSICRQQRVDAVANSCWSSSLLYAHMTSAVSRGCEHWHAAAHSGHHTATGSQHAATESEWQYPAVAYSRSPSSFGHWHAATHMDNHTTEGGQRVPCDETTTASSPCNVVHSHLA